MIDPRHLPKPVTIAEPRRMHRAAIVVLSVLALGWMALLAWVAFPLLSPPAEALAPSAPRLVIPALPSVVTVLILPTATPPPTATPIPTATYAALPTMAPLLCGAWVQTGEVCLWPDATPTPPPTPPPCRTPVPEATCVWYGSRGASTEVRR